MNGMMMYRHSLLYPLLFLSALIVASCSAFGSDAPVISQQSLLRQMEQKTDMLILDVRTPREFLNGHLPKAYNIDHRDIESRMQEIESYRNKPVVVYCRSGTRAGKVESYLIEQGFTLVKHLEGDWSAWNENKLPSE
ncbi:MAG: rhodanese-like domain-containing protein [Mariprofundaceae bacterium]